MNVYKAQVNIGVINYRGPNSWQSNPMIIVTVVMWSHAHVQPCRDTMRWIIVPKNTLCPLTLSLCRAVSPAADRPEKELVNIVFGRGGAEQSGDNGREKTTEMERKDIKMIPLSSKTLGLKAKGGRNL